MNVYLRSHHWAKDCHQKSSAMMLTASFVHYVCCSTKNWHINKVKNLILMKWSLLMKNWDWPIKCRSPRLTLGNITESQWLKTRMSPPCTDCLYWRFKMLSRQNNQWQIGANLPDTWNKKSHGHNDHLAWNVRAHNEGLDSILRVQLSVSKVYRELHPFKNIKKQ